MRDEGNDSARELGQTRASHRALGLAHLRGDAGDRLTLDICRALSPSLLAQGPAIQWPLSPEVPPASSWHASVLARHPRFHAHSIPRARGAIHPSDAMPACRAQRRPLRQGRAQAVRRNADLDAGSYAVTAAGREAGSGSQISLGTRSDACAYVPERGAG